MLPGEPRRAIAIQEYAKSARRGGADADPGAADRGLAVLAVREAAVTAGRGTIEEAMFEALFTGGTASLPGERSPMLRAGGPAAPGIMHRHAYSGRNLLSLAPGTGQPGDVPV